jgi:hypothetical protein
MTTRGMTVKLKTFCILVMFSSAACSSQEPAAPASSAGTQSQAMTGQAAIAKADAMTAPPARGHLPPVTGLAAAPAVRAGLPLDRCPQDKALRSDRKELALAKAQLKAEDARGPVPKLQVPKPSAELLAKQARFLEAAKAERFDTLSLEQRERAHAELKRSILGE